jgi:primosomal replication protein N
MVPSSNLRQNIIMTEKKPSIFRVVDYANNRPLWCDTLYSFKYIPTFQTTLLPQSSGRLTLIAPADSSNMPIYIHHSTRGRIPKDGRLHKYRRESLKSRGRDWANQTKQWPLPSASCPTNAHFFHHRLCIVWATERVVKQTANKTTYLFLLSFFLERETSHTASHWTPSAVYHVQYSENWSSWKHEQNFNARQGAANIAVRHCCKRAASVSNKGSQVSSLSTGYLNLIRLTCMRRSTFDSVHPNTCASDEDNTWVAQQGGSFSNFDFWYEETKEFTLHYLTQTIKYPSTYKPDQPSSTDNLLT